MPAACVIGWPVDHSRSPLIHNYWLKTYGIAGEYRRQPRVLGNRDDPRRLLPWPFRIALHRDGAKCLAIEQEQGPVRRAA